MSEARLVIVEDDPMVAQTTASMVELFGYQPLIFDNALAALEAIPAEKPGLVLLDLNLPGGMSGVDICRQIKSNPEIAHTPVIIISGDGDPQVIHEAMEAGVARYLVKPIGMDELERTIAETLSEQG